MTREQAIKEARNRWGKAGIARASETLSSPERRTTQSDRNTALKARREAINAELAERLNALPWYVALIKERAEVAKELSSTQWNAHYFKFQVGKDLGYAFHVSGSGDTWEQAFAQADARSIS